MARSSGMDFFEHDWYTTGAASYAGSGRGNFVSVTIELKAPSMKRTDLITATFDTVMKKTLKRAEMRYRQVTAGWESKDKPKFVTRKYPGPYKTKQIEIRTYSTPFVFVAGGTSVRYAKMSHDFKPRTSHRSLKSKSKKGRVIARGWMAGVNPGIEGRDFTYVVVERVEAKYRQDMEVQLVKNAAKITKARKKKLMRFRVA